MQCSRRRGARRRAGVALLAALALVAGAVAIASEPGDGGSQGARAHWDYGAKDGPAKWASLSPDWALCAEGRSQSPVELGGAKSAAPAELEFGYEPASLRIAHREHVADVLNNGHTIQVSYDEGSTLEIEGVGFELLQYHFHAPSEHTVGGRHFPMEMHLVHRSDTGALAVLGVLIEAGAHNAAFDPIWENLPTEAGTQEHLDHVTVDVDQLLPGDRRTYRYPGSLTTPPCTEGVRWLVFVTPIQLAEAQIDALRAIAKNNNRPIQPLGQREVLIRNIPVP